MRKVSKGGIQGATFGVMEATIMMLGVLLGLSVTGEKFIILLGVLTAGVADALANAASFYVSEESEMIHTKREIMKASKMCFLGTFLTVIAIAVPLIVIKHIEASVASSFAVGIVILIFLGNYMNKKLKSTTPGRTISKYVLIGALTALLCFGLGELIKYSALFF